MPRFSAVDDCQYLEQPETWNNLKEAIAATSGFKRWQRECLAVEAQLQDLSLDYQVRRYLRETLETLAY